MTEEDREEINRALTAQYETFQTDFMEMHARISVVRLLVEDIYADAFTNRLDEFNARMASILEMTRTASVAVEPMTADQKAEIVARNATHFQRFWDSTKARIVKRSAA